MTELLNQDVARDITHTEEFQSVDAMVSAYDAEGEGPLRKGGVAFNWSLVEALCLPLVEQTADLRVGIWLLRAALADAQIPKVLMSLERIADWTSLSPDLLHPLRVGDDDDIHALILGWLASPGFFYGLGQLRVHASSELTLVEIDAEDDIAIHLQEAKKLELAQQLKQLLAALAIIETHMFEGYSADGRSLIRVSQLLERCLKKLALHSDASEALSVSTQDGALTYTSEILKNRRDVSQMLTSIVAYFQTHEPSHPAPILLNRVQRMLGANFEEVMNELYSDAQHLMAKIERPKAS